MNDEKFLETIFKLVAPGQPLRIAIEKIQEASLGGLIVLSNLEYVEKYIDGGFVLNTTFSPQKVYELAKMDGAVIVSEDLKVIHGANIQLQPDRSVDTNESGTRHRTADRIAKLTNKIVITVSERRKRVTVYKGEFKHSLELLGDLLIKSSQAIMSLEKYANSVNAYMDLITQFELEDNVLLEDVLNGLRHFYLMFIMDKVVRKYIMELGVEGELIELQHREIMINHKNNLLNFIKDYTYKIKKTPENIFEELMKLNNEESRDDSKISKLLGYDLKNIMLDTKLKSKGYRVLGMVNKLTKKDVESIVEKMKSLNNIMNATQNDFNDIKGIGKFKTEKIFKLKEKYKEYLKI